MCDIVLCKVQERSSLPSSSWVSYNRHKPKPNLAVCRLCLQPPHNDLSDDNHPRLKNIFAIAGMMSFDLFCLYMLRGDWSNMDGILAAPN